MPPPGQIPITATLKPGRDKPARGGHPWIFSGAIAAWSSPPARGALVDVRAARGDWLGRGLACPGGTLAVRLYTRQETDILDADFFAARLHRAIQMRKAIVYPGEPGTNAFRLCFSESDGLSGLVVDRYAEVAVLHLKTSVLMPFLPALREVIRTEGLTPLIRTDRDVFLREGADAESFPGDDGPADEIEIQESGFRYRVDVSAGQKTGFYLDQRINRRRVAAYARDRRCLSAYCYTGAFETHLVHGGARDVIALDSSDAAIAQARLHQHMNPGPITARYQVADVPAQLRKYRDERQSFDAIILDPPKFVHHHGQIEKGLRAYKDINLLALKLLTPGGILATFSCSGWIKRDDLVATLAWAAKDAGRDVQILEHLTQPPDHPIHVSFPESDYLCGLIAIVN